MSDSFKTLLENSHSRDYDEVDIHNHGLDINLNWVRKIHSVVLFCFVFVVAVFVCLFSPVLVFCLSSETL